MNSFERILVLSPHADDAEFGCGGMISKFLYNNSYIFIYIFTAISKTTACYKNKKIHVQEALQSLNVFNLYNYRIDDFEIRCFDQHKDSIISKMENLKKNMNPGIIFVPSSIDTHQDHRIITELAINIFKQNTIFGYELPWNNPKIVSHAFIRLTFKDIETKIKAISCYKEQSQKKYFDENYVYNWASMRGKQIGVKYAEAFEVIRLIINEG